MAFFLFYKWLFAAPVICCEKLFKRFVPNHHISTEGEAQKITLLIIRF